MYCCRGIFGAQIISIICMKNVLLIDSGSGGVNILKECVRVVPQCNFLLFCDDANLPYGAKSRAQLQQITLQNLRNIRSFFDFDVVVLACNTLSCTALDAARAHFEDVPFVGTVPAIKPALQKFEPQEILVLATRATLRHNKLVKKYPNLMKKSLPKLAELIDNNLDNLWAVRPYLCAQLRPFFQEGRTPKAVVLGCTHYQAVKDILQEIFVQNTGKKVEFFDSANGVARRLKHFVQPESAGEHNGATKSEAYGKKADEKVGGKADGEVGENDVKTCERDVATAFQVQIMVSGNLNKLQPFWWWFQQ